ncbi:hypothetical protein BRARA_C04461 [Brassica rapa]|uniref:Uncharacterized protein n=1 Tax=Brassica campestris TaxID=3711 RepID=A0A398A419_BRACM|nr:hypothetical protein BRARA_C04461 [Brassica rapa]
MGRCRNREKRLKPYNLGRKMMRMRNLGSVWEAWTQWDDDDEHGGRLKLLLFI